MTNKTDTNDYKVLYSEDGVEIKQSTKGGIGINGAGIQLHKARKMIRLADERDVLDQSELEQALNYSESGVGNVLRLCRILGYHIVREKDGNDSNTYKYRVLYRPHLFPEKLQFLRGSNPITTQANQLSLGPHYDDVAQCQRLPLPQQPANKRFGVNIVMSVHNWQFYQEQVSKLYDEYCLLIDLFNSA